MKLNAGDTFNLKTIKECCQQIFNCAPQPMRCLFVPQSLIARFGDRYTAWYINLDGTLSDDKNGKIWRNYLSEDGTTITEDYLGEQEKLTERDTAISYDCKITFMRLYDKSLGCKNKQVVGFKFVGVFQEQKPIYENGKFKGKKFAKLADYFEF